MEIVVVALVVDVAVTEGVGGGVIVTVSVPETDVVTVSVTVGDNVKNERVGERVAEVVIESVPEEVKVGVLLQTVELRVAVWVTENDHETDTDAAAEKVPLVNVKLSVNRVVTVECRDGVAAESDGVTEQEIDSV
jgi:hypothetical protein